MVLRSADCQGTQRSAPPKLDAHSSHTHTQKLITWVFLSLPAWKGSLTIATSHKRGSMVTMIKLFSAYILRNTVMWEHRRVRQSSCFFMSSQWTSYPFQPSAIINKCNSFSFTLWLFFSFKRVSFSFQSVRPGSLKLQSGERSLCLPTHNCATGYHLPLFWFA